MFVEQLRRAVEASPRVELAKVASLLWKAYAAGHVTEAEASALSEAIEARKALPALQKPVQRCFGSRPRNPASLERRRRWAIRARHGRPAAPARSATPAVRESLSGHIAIRIAMQAPIPQSSSLWAL